MMGISERMQRFKDGYYAEEDSVFSERIRLLLNSPLIDEYCVVDASYYDYSVIPQPILQKYGFFRDMYLIFGITTEGEFISKWVERYDLDSDKPIINGEVQKKEISALL